MKVKAKFEFEVIYVSDADMATLIHAPALGLAASSSPSSSESNATDHNLRPAAAPLARAKSSARPHFPAAMRYLGIKFFTNNIHMYF